MNSRLKEINEVLTSRGSAVRTRVLPPRNSNGFKKLKPLLFGAIAITFAINIKQIMPFGLSDNYVSPAWSAD
jgi:hypothetical protein